MRARLSEDIVNIVFLQFLPLSSQLAFVLEKSELELLEKVVGHISEFLVDFFSKVSESGLTDFSGFECDSGIIVRAFWNLTLEMCLALCDDLRVSYLHVLPEVR